jgi:hypothetical protein
LTTSVRKVTVETMVKQVVPWNPRRISLAIVNNSPTTIYISPDPSNVAEEGFALISNCTLSLCKAWGDDPRIAWYAQVVSGSGELRIFEQFE